MSIGTDGFGETPEGRAWSKANEQDRVEGEIARKAALIVDLITGNPTMPKDQLDAEVRKILRGVIIGENNG
ncbi:MAG: hypothetical protein WAU02_00160 [Candidatus Saccharimonadales bacterium]